MDQKQTFSTIIWKTINSSIVIWFLSTFVIGLFTYFYSKTQDHLRIEKSNREMCEKIDKEIICRLSYLKHLYIANANFNQLVFAIDYPYKLDYPSGIYPEFQFMNLTFLIEELESHEKSANTIALENVRKKTETISEIFILKNIVLKEKPSIELDSKIRRSFLNLMESLNLPRWKSIFDKEFINSSRAASYEKELLDEANRDLLHIPDSILVKSK